MIEEVPAASPSSPSVMLAPLLTAVIMKMTIAAKMSQPAVFTQPSGSHAARLR